LTLQTPGRSANAEVGKQVKEAACSGDHLGSNPSNCDFVFEKTPLAAEVSLRHNRETDGGILRQLVVGAN
jgi:hypothetical protein